MDNEPRNATGGPAQGQSSCDLAVVGGGAAGLAAAIFAAQHSAYCGRRLRIVVLDRAAHIGAKILISGGGRCNVTHESVAPSDFNGSRHIVRNILAGFDVPATVRWFASLGVALKREETGKLFPTTDRARTVVDALLQRCRTLGIVVRTQHRVAAIAAHQITPTPPAAFVIHYAHSHLAAQRVIIATGGQSLPRTGSNGSGWDILRQLGHTVTPVFPALVPLVLRREMFQAELSGLSLDVELSIHATFERRRLVDRRNGSLLFTHFGISGPVVLDASRHWVLAHLQGRSPELRCSFFPGQSFLAVEQLLLHHAKRRPRAQLHRAIGQFLPERLGAALMLAVGLDPSQPIGQCSRRQRRELVRALTACVLPVAHDRGWDFAEVTAGGVPLDEIDFRSMESRRVAGLHLVGELLDCDGRIGGFNFQWAWSTGYAAGRAAATALLRRDTV